MDKQQKAEHEVDLHGLHPHHDDIWKIIEAALREAHENGKEWLKFIHGHGKNRHSWRPPFANTNTGFMGVTVRGILRNDAALRPYMLAKIDVSHDGSTTVRIRRRK